MAADPVCIISHLCVHVCNVCVVHVCNACVCVSLQALQALFQPLQGGHSLIKDAVVPYSVEEVCVFPPSFHCHGYQLL